MTVPTETETSHPRRRLVPLGLQRSAMLVALLAVLGATTVYALEKAGFMPYGKPFVLYNLNRIDALIDRAQRTVDGTVVVALGTSRLRMATLDEAAMAERAAADGQPPLHFLRIANNAADFADFEPLLDRIIVSRPDLVLLDMDLLFRERRPLAFLKERLRETADALVGDNPYSLDQVNLQYGKSCAPPAPGGVGRFVDEERGRFVLSAGSPAYDRVRAFAQRAADAGIAVVVLEMRRPPAVEQRRFDGAPYLPEAMARLAADEAFDVWHFPRPLQRDASYCNFMHLNAEARDAYSSWLVTTIGNGTAATRIEAVSLR